MKIKVWLVLLGIGKGGWRSVGIEEVMFGLNFDG